MEGLNENERQTQQATVGDNGQDFVKHPLDFIIHRLVVVPDILRYRDITDKVNQIVEAIQKIEPSYTEKEITQLIQNMYEEDYNEISYEDYLICLGIQNLHTNYIQGFIYDFPNIYIKTNFDYFTKSHCQKIMKIFANYDALKKLGKIKDEKECIQQLMNSIYYAAQERLGFITKTENEPRIKNLIYQYYVNNGIDKEVAEQIADEIIVYAPRSMYKGCPIDYINKEHKDPWHCRYVKHDFTKKEQSIHILSQIKIETHIVYKIGGLDLDRDIYKIWKEKRYDYSLFRNINIEDKNEKGKITINEYLIEVSKLYDYSFDFEIEEE